MKIGIWDDMKSSTKVGHVSISMRIVGFMQGDFFAVRVK
jgi:NMD protein affecting ribosome stability and mRNA decay